MGCNGSLDLLKLVFFIVLMEEKSTISGMNQGNSLQFRQGASLSKSKCLWEFNKFCGLQYSDGHLLVITGYKWDYTFYKWGYNWL